ncbi:MAG: peptidylprolyl isomerase [Salibacteraceae bacterium]
MKIEKGKVVTLTYELIVEEEMVDQADLSKPLSFLYGAGALLADFETNINGMEAGDEFKFSLTPPQGYGRSVDANIFELPIDLFIQDGERSEALQMGAVLPMQTQEGQVVNGKVVHIGLDKVKMDFNHPLADKTLDFSGKVIEVRDATQDEVDHGHAHGQGGHEQ